MQSLATTIKVASPNPANGDVYSIQHYVIKFVTDFQLVGGFLRVLQFHNNPHPNPVSLKYEAYSIYVSVTCSRDFYI